MAQVAFTCGNPTNQHISGTIQLDSSATHTIAMLDIPSYISIAEFRMFIKDHDIDTFSHLLVLQTSSTYAMIIQFKEQIQANRFAEQYRNKYIDEIEMIKCAIEFLRDIVFDEQELKYEFPRKIEESCAICLEKLDPFENCVIAILCSHLFHFRCLSKWSDSSCPVCRFSITPNPLSACDICGITEDIWICIICGSVGCGRYSQKHALFHYQESGHTLSLDVETQRVWDYASENYVHRVLQNRTDGKLVPMQHQGDQLLNQVSDYIVPTLEHHASLKLEHIHTEYVYLLTSQLNQQKDAFIAQMKSIEDDGLNRIREMESLYQRKIASLKEFNLRLNELEEEKVHYQDMISKSQQELQEMCRKIDSLNALNTKLIHSQSELSKKVHKSELELMKEIESSIQEKRDRISALKEQLSDLKFYQKSQRALSKNVDIVEGKLYMFESPEKEEKSRRSSNSSRRHTPSKRI
jgi:BRCA1-associated protein